MTGLNVIFAGSGEFGIPTLRAILEAGHKLVQVVTQPDRPAGRGQKLTPTAVSTFAAERGLPLLHDSPLLNRPRGDYRTTSRCGARGAVIGSSTLHGKSIQRSVRFQTYSHGTSDRGFS